MHERREGRCALCDLADAAVQLALQREGLVERAVRDLHPVRRAVGEGVSGQRGRAVGLCGLPFADVEDAVPDLRRLVLDDTLQLRPVDRARRRHDVFAHDHVCAAA